MSPEQYKALMDKLINIELMLGQSYRGPSADDGGAVAPDSDLDGDHGNPTVKYDLKPKYWSGASMVGKRWSECPPEWLDACAAYLSNYASALRDNPKEEDDAKKAKYKEKDASRARGWAKRLRSGWRPAGAARPQGAPRFAPPTPTAAAYGQAPPRGFGADATGQGQQTSYGAPAYGASPVDHGQGGAGGDDQDIPF
jgi:hypothetical protein